MRPMASLGLVELGAALAAGAVGTTGAGADHAIGAAGFAGEVVGVVVAA